MDVGGPLIVVQVADSRGLLVVLDLLVEDLELKFHEVDLLLQIRYVVVLRVHLVGVFAEDLVSATVLASELHLDVGLVGVTRSEVSTEGSSLRVSTCNRD